VPFKARFKRCGAKRRTSRVGPVKFVSISRLIVSGVVLEGSKRLKLFWIPELMMTLSREGKSFRRDSTCVGKASRSLMSNYINGCEQFTL
jgi:hypothetical protein